MLVGEQTVLDLLRSSGESRWPRGARCRRDRLARRSRVCVGRSPVAGTGLQTRRSERFSSKKEELR